MYIYASDYMYYIISIKFEMLVFYYICFRYFCIKKNTTDNAKTSLFPLPASLARRTTSPKLEDNDPIKVFTFL